MDNPISTYRVQLHRDFTLKDLDAAVPYLIELGVGTLYASPVFEAVPGSVHGYDVINTQRINPEIGTLEELRALSRRLRDAGIGWLQDIVPNHMAFHPGNAWLMDVLRKGEASPYFRYFDFNLRSKDDKIMAPFLGCNADEALAKGELKIGIEGDRHVFRYFDSHWPLNDAAEASILQHGGAEVANSDPEFLRGLLEGQAYRLCCWQDTDKAINYRRFFTVNGLISLNAQHPETFEATHALIRELVEDGTFTGLRVDHIDGLQHPKEYLERLRKLAGEKTYIVVEKILGSGEELPRDWPVAGTTGYDFLALVNNLLTRESSEDAFDDYYRSITGKGEASVSSQMHEKKRDILLQHMRGEQHALCRLFRSSALVSEDEIAAAGLDYLEAAIGELLVYSPVYRYYAERMPLSKTGARQLQDMLGEIRKDNEALSAATLLLQKALVDAPAYEDRQYGDRALRFYQRLMQYSGPLMAKGVEDTLMYTYNRFIGHNEVGDSPEAFGISPKQFARAMQQRRAHWPMTMNATATHDTKRGEDARARLNVLTELAEEWLEEVAKWHKLNKELIGDAGPDRIDEYLLYQNLVASWPMPGSAMEDYEERLKAYLEKALREAKRHSSWSAPDEAYEKAVADFAAALLQPGSDFCKRFRPFAEKVANLAVQNSLSQLLIKCLAPGLPDIYQGTELWDFSFVDPDNRRPVDYERRHALLRGVGAKPDLAHLWATRLDGRIKLWLTQRLLQLRREHAPLFADGQFEMLHVSGRYGKHICAFGRRLGSEWIIGVVPLHAAALTLKQEAEHSAIDWKDTAVQLPAGRFAGLRHLLSGEVSKPAASVSVQDLFGVLPFAVLQLSSKPGKRGAGILLPVASLPSEYGIGDFGPEARSFADFLARSGQRYWQVLPLNPIEDCSGHSPYSSYSSFAGNALLVSPDEMAALGLLDEEDLKEVRVKSGDRIDYGEAESIKVALFNKAWELQRAGLHNSAGFQAFIREQSGWLDDFALFIVLREAHGGAAWNEWPARYRDRDPVAMAAFGKEHSEAIDRVKWLQFICNVQWQSLKKHSNSVGIRIFGDMPFYVSHDSADVWAARDIFCLDEKGEVTGMAGVPPDYFCAEGQLWGMPTFNWAALRASGYDWWIRRLRRNMELFDLLRIDHFRAMSEYWQVPAGEATAKNGQWMPGPGADFFAAAEAALGRLPLVAEDLGDNMEKVYALRDELGLPGMKVLQFAFGDNMPESVDIPHNHRPDSIVYTGTHDNNTVLGWYREESGKSGHKHLERYLGHKVKEKDLPEVMVRMAYASVGETVILPMQDVLGLDEDARINMPGEGKGNWRWRLEEKLLTGDVEKAMREWVETYGR